MDQELADAAVYAPGRCCVCSHQMAALSALNDIMAAILKLWHKIKNPTPSIDAYLLEEQSCQISS